MANHLYPSPPCPSKTSTIARGQHQVAPVLSDFGRFTDFFLAVFSHGRSFINLFLTDCTMDNDSLSSSDLDGCSSRINLGARHWIIGCSRAIVRAIEIRKDLVSTEHMFGRSF
jgi:hypothetical protein